MLLLFPVSRMKSCWRLAHYRLCDCCSLLPCSSSARCLLLWTSSWRRWRASYRPASGTNSPASDLDRTGPDTESDPGPGADLHPDRNGWTETQNSALDWTDTHLCQEFKPNWEQTRTGGGTGQKRQNNGIKNWFWLYLICLHFLGFQSFKAVLLLYKKRWSVAIIKKKWEDKKIQ